MKNKIYINELSLDGQYESMEEFVIKNKPFIFSLNWLQKQGWDIFKKSTLYEAPITFENKMFDLRSWKGTSASGERDLLLKYKRILLAAEDNPPFWDTDGIEHDGDYYLFDRNISDSSVAEACEHSKMLLSFSNEAYEDHHLVVDKNHLETIDVASITSIRFLAKVLYKNSLLTINEYIKLYYKNTRLNFSKMEEEYGLQTLEKKEIEDCLNHFERYVNHLNWEDLNTDRSLNYKEYSPASINDNWFKNTEYQEKNIYKFRCGNPKRCYGYREGEQFYVLRIERTHKISDKG